MTHDEWIGIPAALEIIEQLGNSIGAARALLVEACASEVRSREKLPPEAEKHRPPEAEKHRRPGPGGMMFNGRWVTLRLLAPELWRKVVIDGDCIVDTHDISLPVEISLDDLRKYLNPNAAPAEDPRSAYRTGAPGHPTSKQLVEIELDGRVASLKQGEFLGKSITDAAMQLAEWLKLTHPKAPPMTWKTIKNALGDKIRPRVQNARN